MSLTPSIGTFLVRLAIGGIMIVHGAGKVFVVGPAAMSMSQFTGFLAGLGLPAAPLLAWFVALVELVGGVCILVGIGTRLAALAVASDMFVATVLVHLPKGFSDAELTIVLCVVSLALAVTGAGKLSLEELVFDEQSRSLLPVGG